MSIQLLLALCVTLSLAGVAGAQGGPPPAGPPPGGAPPAGRAARAGQRNAVPPQRAENIVQEQWNTLVLRQSRQFLHLTEQQEPNFLAKMMRLQDVRDQNLRKRRQLISELGKMTNPDETNAPNETTLSSKVNELRDFDAKAFEQERAALAAVDEVLTPLQRARFRFFEERMEVRKAEMLAQVMRSGPPVANAQPGAGRNNQSPAPAKPGRGGGGLPF